MDEKKELKDGEISKISGGSRNVGSLKAYGGPFIRPNIKYGGPKIKPTEPIKPTPKAYGGPIVTPVLKYGGPIVKPDMINHIAKYGGPPIKLPEKPEEALNPSDPMKPETKE